MSKNIAYLSAAAFSVLALTATITAPGLPPAKLSLTGQLAAKPAVKAGG